MNKGEEMKMLTNSYQTDGQTKKRFDLLKKFFSEVKNGERSKYVDFERYYLYLNKEDNMDGLRWFHKDKYKVEVVVNAENEPHPHKNIAGFVLFSKYDDAILHMTLKEQEAVRILHERDKKNGVI